METTLTIELLTKKLQGRLLAIQSKRPEYSLRAFSRDIGLPAPIVSEVLRGKREITARLACQICEALTLSTQETEEVLNTLGKSKSGASRYQQLSQDEFHAISDWYGFAVLSLLELKHKDKSADWISQKLNISKRQTLGTLEALERMELISKSGHSYQVTGKAFRTTQDVPSDAIKKNHRQGLELAKASLFDTDIELREFSANTIAVSQKDLPELKEALRMLRRKFAKKASTSEIKDSVYRLQIQFFPLTQGPQK